MELYPNLIKEALSKVRYPGTGKDIVSMGMLCDDIRISPDGVSFSLLFERKTDPFIKSIVKSAETQVKLAAGTDVNVSVGVQVRQEHEEPEAPALPKVRNIIAIGSGKGGVGKSTVSANLAVALAQKGYKTGLLDADIFGPSIPKMFQVEDARPYATEVDGRNLIVPVEKYGVKVLSIGFFVDPEQAVIWRGAMASNAIKQLLTETDWGELDYLLIDLPPGTSDIQLTLIQTIDLTGALIVSTPQQVAIADARRCMDMFRNPKVDVPVIGIIENMSWFTPEELPDNRYYLFGKGGCDRLAQESGCEVLGRIPIVQGICDSGDSGQPIALDPLSIPGKAFLDLADRIIP